MTGLVIRKMNRQDVPAVHRMGISQQAFSSKNGTFWSMGQLEKWCKSSCDVLLVAEIDNKIIGFTLFSVHTPTGKVTWENLYVLPDNRRGNIASALIEEGLKQIMLLGCKYVVGFVNAENKEAILNLAKKFDFAIGNEVIWIDLIINEK